jgi:hypothetical protein
LPEAPIQSGPDPVKVEPVAEEKMIVEETPIKEEVDVEAIIQAAVIEAAQAERALVEAAAEDFIRKQQAEADAHHEAERAAWANETQRNLAVIQQKMEALEMERAREKETAANMQRYQAERIRTLQATSAAQAQPDRDDTKRSGVSRSQLRRPFCTPESSERDDASGCDRVRHPETGSFGQLARMRPPGPVQSQVENVPPGWTGPSASPEWPRSNVPGMREER